MESGNRTGQYNYTPILWGQHPYSGSGTSDPLLLLRRALPWIQVCSLQLREALGHSLAALWVSFHSLGWSASLGDCFRRMVALFSCDSTYLGSFHHFISSTLNINVHLLLAQDQYRQLSILQKMTRLLSFPISAFHKHPNQWCFIDTVRQG